MTDRYANFAELVAAEPRDAWRIVRLERSTSDVLVIAPHGGGIEPFTTAIATAIAGGDYSVYCFEGLKGSGNGELHVTSHRFDEPTALSLAAQSSIVLGIHGCKGAAAIHVGGLDKALVALLTDTLVEAGLPADSTGHKFPAVEPNNICNRSKRKCGAQLEITRDLREDDEARARITAAARKAITKHLEAIVHERRSRPGRPNPR
jgi:phage replication-related protein YjqB (UPF0714/DUF867 family)